MIYIGPYDLSISHGFKPDKVFVEKKMLNIYKQVLKIAKKFGKKTAIHCSGPDTGRFFLKMGFDFVTLSTDLALLKKSVLNEQDKVKNFLINIKK